MSFFGGGGQGSWRGGGEKREGEGHNPKKNPCIYPS